MHPSVGMTPTGRKFEQEGPWYRQRWPWLLMLGPALVVVAGVFTGYLAYTRQDAVVVGDYYKKGKAINQELKRDKVASAMRLSLSARYDAPAGLLRGELSSFGRPLAAPFTIRLAHSTLPAKDVLLQVKPDAQGRFVLALPMLEQARWQVVAEGGEGRWRLASVWQWPAQPSVEIDADREIVK